MNKQKHNIELLLKKPFAHRGLHSNNMIAPENSMIAFQKAIDANFGIEIDVHLLSDNKVVVIHDSDLARLCGIDKTIEETTSKDLINLKLLESNYSVPLFIDVLKLINGQVPLLIEIKTNCKCKKRNIEKYLFEELKNYNGEYAIQSFSPWVLYWFKKNAPNILRGQLSSYFLDEKMGFIKKYVLKNLLLNFISEPNFIAYNLLNMPNKIIEKQKNKGLKILCWTIKTKDEYIKIKQMCDNIIFENIIP